MIELVWGNSREQALSRTPPLNLTSLTDNDRQLIFSSKNCWFTSCVSIWCLFGMIYLLNAILYKHIVFSYECLNNGGILTLTVILFNLCLENVKFNCDCIHNEILVAFMYGTTVFGVEVICRTNWNHPVVAKWRLILPVYSHSDIAAYRSIYKQP